MSPTAASGVEPASPSPAAERPSVAAIREMFAPRSHWQAWLDVEVALARTQAELGMIPPPAAAEICRKASFEYIDATALAADIAATQAPIVSLVRALARVCEGDAGGYVHWGATTQNVMQTARILLMRRAHDAFMARFADVLRCLAELADDGAQMLVAGRTNVRQALPITFGFKVAAWIEEFLRHRERFDGARDRVFASLWGGAIGAMHAAGEQGQALNRRLSARLGLTPLAVPSRAGTDHVAEHVLLLALFSASCAKVARELYTLMSDEVDEVMERQGDEVVGSSTMPNKVNPKAAVQVISIAARLRTLAPLAFEAVQPTHEGDAANNQMLYSLIDQASPLAYELVSALHTLLECIELRPQAMRRNLELSGSAMAAENAMMLLAPHFGRGRAYEIVKKALATAAEQQRALADVLLDDGAVRAASGEAALRHALDPASYTGQSVPMSHAMAAAARDAAQAVERSLSRASSATSAAG